MTRYIALLAGLLLCVPTVGVAEGMTRSLRPKPRPAHLMDVAQPPAVKAISQIRPRPRPTRPANAAASVQPAPVLPVVTEPAHSPPKPPPVLFAGQDVFAASEVRCGVQADFLRGYWAEVIEAGPEPRIRLREHLAVIATHGLTDAEGNPDTVSEFWGDYWCIPQRAWCFGPVKDTAFGARLVAGQILVWSAADVAPIEASFVPAFMDLRDRRCNQAAAAPEIYVSPLTGPQ